MAAAARDRCWCPAVVAGTKARAIAAGARHTCAIDDDAAVAAGARTSSGQLGNGSTEPSNSRCPSRG